MFSGLSRRRDNVKVIRLGSVSNITLAGDDPDFIVIEVFDLTFNTSKINLPSTAPIGKQFKFALTTAPKENPALTTQYVDIIVPLNKGVGVDNVWRMFSGQRPIFIYGQNGWVSEAGHLLSTSGGVDRTDLAVGSHANGSDSGTAVGYLANGSSNGAAVGRNANGSSRGVATGFNANGSTDGVAVGYGANGNGTGAAVGYNAEGYSTGAAVGYLAKGYTNGAAVGYNASGYDNGAALGRSSTGYTNGVAVGSYSNGNNNGTAVGYAATTNAMDAAVSLGYNSKAQRYRELVKSADRAATQLKSWSMVDWYGTTTDATATLLLLGGVANQRCVLLNNSAFMFVIQGVAAVTGAGTTAGFHIIGTIKRGADAASTVLVGTPTVTSAGSNDTAITLAVSADTTNGALVVTATGLAATTISWNVTATLSETRF